MRIRGGVRPSKPTSAVGFVVGIVFIGIGVFLVIPMAGAFGVLWTLVAIGITVFHAVNAFSDRGIPHEVLEFETTGSLTESAAPPVRTTEQRLTDLEGLKGKGLVSTEEYEEQRQRILEGM